MEKETVLLTVENFMLIFGWCCVDALDSSTAEISVK